MAILVLQYPFVTVFSVLLITDTLATFSTFFSKPPAFFSPLKSLGNWEITYIVISQFPKTYPMS